MSNQPKTNWRSIGAIWKKTTGAGEYITLDPEVIPDVLQHAEPMRNGMIAVQIFAIDKNKNPRGPEADLCVPIPDDGHDKSEPPASQRGGGGGETQRGEEDDLPFAHSGGER